VGAQAPTQFSWCSGFFYLIYCSYKGLFINSTSFRPPLTFGPHSIFGLGPPLIVVVAQVDVGDFLRFKSCVLYTQLDNPEQPLVNVEVVAHVTRPELRKSEVTIPESHSVLPWITLFALHKLHPGLSFFFSRFNAC
jgi:hypothetical protein